jgi:predicted RNase H-like HicB family nuclease
VTEQCSGRAKAAAIDSPGHPKQIETVKAFTAVIERCPDTGLYVGFVPGFAGAHSQGESLDELQGNLREVIEMLLEDGEPKLESEFVGTQSITVAA